MFCGPFITGTRCIVRCQDGGIYRVFQKKTAQSLRHYNFAAVRHRVVQFLVKYSEENCLHEKASF